MDKIFYCPTCEEFVCDDDAVRKVHKELHTELDVPAYEEWITLHCPHCYYELIEEAKTCQCGAPMREDQYLCPVCEKEVRQAWNTMVSGLVAKLNDPDAELYVLDWVEGEF